MPYIYEITHSDGIGSNFIIPTGDVDSASHQDELVRLITQSPVFSHASRMITRISEFYYDAIKGFENRLNVLKDGALNYLEDYDENADWEEIHQESDIKLDGFYLATTNTATSRSVSDGIKVYAHQNGIAVYPLEERSRYLVDLIKTTGHMSIKPKNVAKFLFFQATLPLSASVNVALIAKRDMQKRKDNYQDYIEGNYKHMLRHAYDNSVKNEYIIAEGVRRWLEDGFIHDETNPTSQGLTHFLKHYEDAVIVLDAPFLFLPESGLLDKLKELGFTVQVRDINYNPYPVNNNDDISYSI